MGRHSSECSIFSCVLQDTTPRFVRPSVGRLVGWSVRHILLLGSSPEGADDLCFHMGEISPSPSTSLPPPPSSCLKTQIQAPRPKFQT